MCRSWLEAAEIDNVSPMQGCPSGQREQTVNLPANAYGGSNPPPCTIRAQVAQSVERVLGKDKVTGSIPVLGSTFRLALGTGVAKVLTRSELDGLPHQPLL